MTSGTKHATKDTEEQLIQRAQDALNRCNWVIGECAAEWTQKYARGRTDADFGSRIGLSGDQVYQRRRVWETFSDVYDQYENLKWSHFYAAINWDDASDCLGWADEMRATVAEMKAWRRAQHGEDLAEPSDEGNDFAQAPIEYLSAAAGFVRDPSEFGADGSGGSLRRGRSEDDATVGAAARETGADGDDYAPFGNTARGAAPTSEAGKPRQSTEAILQSLTRALERHDKALTPEVIEGFADVTAETRQRFRTAMKNIAAKTASLK